MPCAPARTGFLQPVDPVEPTASNRITNLPLWMSALPTGSHALKVEAVSRGESGRVLLWTLLVVVGVAAAAVAALVVVDRQARSGDEVRVIDVPYLGGPGAITTGRIIFVHEGRADDAELLAHELIHVCQWEQGRLEFLWEYASEYGSNLAELRDAGRAYREMSFEEQARAGGSDCDFEVYAVP